MPPSTPGSRVSKSSSPTQSGRTAMRCMLVALSSNCSRKPAAPSSPRWRRNAATYSGTKPSTSVTVAAPRNSKRCGRAASRRAVAVRARFPAARRRPEAVASCSSWPALSERRYSSREGTSHRRRQGHVASVAQRVGRPGARAPAILGGVARSRATCASAACVTVSRKRAVAARWEGVSEAAARSTADS
jgi:hypothetical protein